MEKSTIERTTESDWKTRTYLVGGALGALVGLLTAYLYARSAEEDSRRGNEKPKPVATRDVVSLGLSVLSLIRQVTELGKSGKK